MAFSDRFGNRLYLQRQSYIDWNIYFFGAYEAYLLRLLSDVSSRIDSCVFADIGANIGLHTIHLSRSCQNIYAFEPVPLILAKLEKNISLNCIQHAEVLKFGLGETTRELPFIMPDLSNLGSGRFATNAQSGAVPLSIVKGDEFFLQNDRALPQLIKIDVEGFEKEVLAGMRQTLREARPVIILEYYETTREKIKQAGGFQALLPPGYQIMGVQSLNNSRYALRPFEEGVTTAYGDLLCFPAEKRELIP